MDSGFSRISGRAAAIGQDIRLPPLAWWPYATKGYGNSALELLRARDDVAMLITDVVMPGAIDGFALADRCREIRSDLPIMLVSGYPLDIRVSQRQERWSGVLLQKPYRTDELAAAAPLRPLPEKARQFDPWAARRALSCTMISSCRDLVSE